MRKRWVLAALTVSGLLSACGESESSGDGDDRPAGPPDGVLWVDYLSRTDHQALWLGESRTYPWASSVGTSYWSPDRTRMFVEETEGKFAIVTAQGERHRVSPANSSAFA